MKLGFVFCLLAALNMEAQAPDKPSPPSLISKVEPTYTEEARKAKVSGSVLVRVMISEEGIPEDITVLRGLGYQLDESAITAVSKWRFRPAMKDGKPVRTHANIEVSFRLLDGGNLKPPSGPPATAEEAYRRASAMQAANNWEGAIELLTAAIKMKPDWPEAYAAKANAENRANKNKEAVEDYTRAIALDPKNADWVERRAGTYAVLRQAREAMDDYNRAIQMNPAPPASYFTNRGREFLAEQDPQKAIDDFTKAITLSPSMTAAYEGRAQAYGQQNDWAKAVADRTAVIELSPTSQAYAARGHARRQQGDEQGAAEDARQAGEQSNEHRGSGSREISDSDPLNPSLAAPKLLVPVDKQEFDIFPRRTVLNWEPVPGAASYLVEWDYGYDGIWDADKKGKHVAFSTADTAYVFNFVGKQPGRWRVYAVDSKGLRGPASEWRTFNYLK